MDGLASIPSRRTLLVVAVISGVLTLVLALMLRAIDQHLTPYSIIEYEFALSRWEPGSPWLRSPLRSWLIASVLYVLFVGLPVLVARLRARG
jgi:hypothetical protein